MLLLQCHNLLGVPPTVCISQEDQQCIINVMAPACLLLLIFSPILIRLDSDGKSGCHSCSPSWSCGNYFVHCHLHAVEEVTMQRNKR